MAEIRETLSPGTEIELWFQDEARVGQKNKITRRWARRGTRPSAPHDQRTQSAYIFGAICPAKGKAAGLVMPHCDTQAMTAHLNEISAMVAPSAHCCCHPRSGWMASLRGARDPCKHHAPAAAIARARAEPGRKHLAVSSRQLALKPCLQRLRRHTRLLLQRLEPTHNETPENHVYRSS